MEMMYPSDERLPQVNETELQAIVRSTPDVRANALEISKAIHNQPTVDAAVVWCQDRMAEMDVVENKYSTLREFLHRSHKAVTARIADLVAPRKEAIAVVKEGIRAWKWKEDQKRRDEEARLAAEAKKREEEQKINAAITLEEQGNETMANVVLNSPSLAAAPVIPEAKAKDASVRKSWGVRVTDKTALLKAVAGGAVPELAIEVDVAWLKKMAKQMDGNLNYPGIEVFPDDDIAIGRKR